MWKIKKVKKKIPKNPNQPNKTVPCIILFFQFVQTIRLPQPFEKFLAGICYRLGHYLALNLSPELIYRY